MKVEIILELSSGIYASDEEVVSWVTQYVKSMCMPASVFSVKVVDEYLVPVVFEGKNRHDHMTVDDFCQAVADGTFTDYDGHGKYASSTHYDKGTLILPSHVVLSRDKLLIRRGALPNKPAWATHVVWFNR